jgi:hypothetical protein
MWFLGLFFKHSIDPLLGCHGPFNQFGWINRFRSNYRLFDLLSSSLTTGLILKVCANITKFIFLINIATHRIKYDVLYDFLIT